ncbi:hypothetical protein CRENBAI_017578 [Crenichthys baileyi]|uniref:Uncharacterized protein n=1 Tax=Crenichthys baileyi TaxID=28760 RepID=A0AAV9SIN6_9TELE
MSLALDLDPVSVPGFLSLPSPWFYLPKPTCLSFLPGLPVLAQSPVKRPVPAFLVYAPASTCWSVSLGLSAIRHWSVGHSRTDVLGWLLIDHLPAEELFPGSLSHTDPEKVSGCLDSQLCQKLIKPLTCFSASSGSWVLIGGCQCSCFQDHNKSFNFVLCLWLKFWVFSPGLNAVLLTDLSY